MRDLVALSALPAVWAGYQPRQVAEGLADVLLSTLRLDLVYLRLRGQTDGPGIEVARTAGGSTPTEQTRDIGRALAPWLDGAGIGSAPPLPNPAGPGLVARTGSPRRPRGGRGVLFRRGPREGAVLGGRVPVPLCRRVVQGRVRPGLRPARSGRPGRSHDRGHAGHHRAQAGRAGAAG